MFATLPGYVGASQIQLSGQGPDAAQVVPMGQIVTANDPWWGAGEFIYARANGSIRSMGLCVLTPVFDSTTATWRVNATEVPNTGNLGRALCVAPMALASGEFSWFMISGVTPVDCNASVAADTTFGIAAAGQGGANSAGKQVLSARIMAAGATTVVKTNCSGVNGATSIRVPNADGWFPGVFLSGTGIGAASRVVKVSKDSRTVTVSVANSAAVTGSVTATYNNATIFYNVAHLMRPFAQGAIT